MVDGECKPCTVPGCSEWCAAVELTPRTCCDVHLFCLPPKFGFLHSAPCSPGDPAVCTYCEFDGEVFLAVDPATGQCVPCRAPNCDGGCDTPTRCSESGCVEGYGFDKATEQCTLCTAVGCSSCDVLNKCDEDSCLLKYWWDAAAGVCAPCPEGCKLCQLPPWGTCERCEDGYYLDADTKQCKQVRSRGMCLGSMA